MESFKTPTIEELREGYLAARDDVDVDRLQEIEAVCLSRERILLRNGWGLTTLAYGGLAVACRIDINWWEGRIDGAETN